MYRRPGPRPNRRRKQWGSPFARFWLALGSLRARHGWTLAADSRRIQCAKTRARCTLRRRCPECRRAQRAGTILTRRVRQARGHHLGHSARSVRPVHFRRTSCGTPRHSDDRPPRSSCSAPSRAPRTPSRNHCMRSLWLPGRNAHLFCVSFVRGRTSEAPTSQRTSGHHRMHGSGLGKSRCTQPVWGSGANETIAQTS